MSGYDQQSVIGTIPLNSNTVRDSLVRIALSAICETIGLSLLNPPSTSAERTQLLAAIEISRF